MTRSSSVPTLLVAASILTTACAVQTNPLPTGLRPAPRAVTVRVTEDGRTAIRRISLEEYVRTAIISEFAPAAGEMPVVQRMLEVQAVISRTYALAHLGRHRRDGYDLCSTTHCQLFEPARLRKSRWAGAGTEAARRTAGMVLWFDRSPASALFHSDCGGHTSAPSAVWGSVHHPYLLSAADDGPAASAHTTWRYELSRDALKRTLNGDIRTAPGRRLDGVVVDQRDAAGRAVRISIRGERRREVAGEVLRDVLTRALGARTIKSTWFDIDQRPASFVFEGRGFGHGVGLCQTGALARITAGATPTAVLARYFPGTRLVTLP